MQRYFGEVIDNTAILSPEDEHHLLKVMRINKGEQIEVVDKSGLLYLCEIISFSPLTIKVDHLQKEDHELRCKLILVMALLKGEKMNLVLQKATEIGASEIILLETSRCISKINKEDKLNKLTRYSKILKEASEQSKRTSIPILNKVISMKDVSLLNGDIKLLAYEKADPSTQPIFDKLENCPNGSTIIVAVGPEGGYSLDEVSMFKQSGFDIISLGKRILRAETASIYILSLVSAILER